MFKNYRSWVKTCTQHAAYCKTIEATPLKRALLNHMRRLKKLKLIEMLFFLCDVNFCNFANYPTHLQ